MVLVFTLVTSVISRSVLWLVLNLLREFCILRDYSRGKGCSVKHVKGEQMRICGVGQSGTRRLNCCSKHARLDMRKSALLQS